MSEKKKTDVELEEELIKALGNKNAAKRGEFCRRYVVHFNGARAAREAGYSPDTAREQASFLLSNINVKDYIAFLTERIVTEAEVGVKRTLREYARLAYSDPRQFVDEDGNLIPLHKLSDEAAAALSGLDIKTIRDADTGEESIIEYKYKLPNKQQALDSIGKYHKMFVDRIEFSADDALAAAIMAGRERVKSGSD